MHLMEMCQGESVKVLCLIYTHQCLFVYLIREEQVEKNRRVLRNNVSTSTCVKAESDNLITTFLLCMYSTY